MSCTKSPAALPACLPDLRQWRALQPAPPQASGAAREVRNLVDSMRVACRIAIHTQSHQSTTALGSRFLCPGGTVPVPDPSRIRR